MKHVFIVKWSQYDINLKTTIGCFVNYQRAKSFASKMAKKAAEIEKTPPFEFIHVGGVQGWIASYYDLTKPEEEQLIYSIEKYPLE